MIIVLIAVIFVLTPFFLIFDLKKSEGTLKKAVKITSSVLAGLIVLTLAFSVVVNCIGRADSAGHVRHGGGILGGMSYKGSENGLNHFIKSGFLTGGTDIYVPESTAELPGSAKLLKTVIIYTDGEPVGDENAYPDKNVWTNVAKISTDYTAAIILALFWESVILFGAGLFIFIIIIGNKGNKKQQELN